MRLRTAETADVGVAGSSPNLTACTCGYVTSLDVGFVNVSGVEYITTVGFTCSSRQYQPDPGAAGITLSSRVISGQCSAGGCTSIVAGTTLVGSLLGIVGVQDAGRAGSPQTAGCTGSNVVLSVDTSRHNSSTVLPDAASRIRVGCGQAQVCAPPPSPPLPPSPRPPSPPPPSPRPPSPHPPSPPPYNIFGKACVCWRPCTVCTVCQSCCASGSGWRCCRATDQSCLAVCVQCVQSTWLWARAVLPA